MMKKVLTVDDDVDIRKVVSKLVEKSGYEAIEAKNGVEGMGKVREDKPDLIILDMLMPKESGVRMYHELKTEESLKDIPVIVLSAIPKKSFLKSQKVLDEFAGQSVPEPEAYIEKPEEPEELIALMKKILG
ncbi:MAG: response regulator [Deltaproteobacteria bacterium]|nr:response regulator [Deltaproteobacteria bacterium]RLB17716.1 MAG: response regulator [Deltaproteobacteria bacterium]RLB25681.1 MAG: response regulator [Deltaproteobacteria bacterium]HDH87785.1 response regulator [Desulfobacteraceae bacterium]